MWKFIKLYHRRLRRAGVPKTYLVKVPHSGDSFRAHLENLKKEYGFKEPDRGDLEDPDILWRSGKPDYSKVR